MPAHRTPYSLDPSSKAFLFAATRAFTKAYMSTYDSSHDLTHIHRVTSLTRHLLTHHPDSSTLDATLTTLAALLHDVGDKKYSTADSSPTPVRDFLLSIDAPEALAQGVQTVVTNVSFSNEVKHPEEVRDVLQAYPELAVVQDADRLDAIGAVGIARCFVFGAVKDAGRGMGGSVEHFREKLVKLEGMMKTEEGKRLARERTRRIEEFEGWWREETGGVEEWWE
jgi:uncharacterized protein